MNIYLKAWDYIFYGYRENHMLLFIPEIVGSSDI